MKRILIFTFSLLYEDCIFSINSIFYTHNYGSTDIVRG
jgi:hypothetical protein